MNKKGFATSTIVFTLLSVFLISISILLVTITNTNKTKNTLNEKVVSNIEYGNSSMNDLEQRVLELENNTLKIDNVYPVGSIYMSNNLKTVEEVHNALGGIWEKYSEGRTIIGDGVGTDINGTIKTFKNDEVGGEYSHKLTIQEMPIHSHNDGTSGSAAFDITAVTNPNSSSAVVAFDNTYGRPTTSAGGDKYHNNIEPYIVTYIYKRVK